jgi:hypothetical protein
MMTSPLNLLSTSAAAEGDRFWPRGWGGRQECNSGGGGEPLTEIAKTFNCSHSTISRLQASP